MNAPLLLRLVAAAEFATGVALLILPTAVSRLLLGADVAGAGLAAGRVAGIALISLAVACWPEREAGRFGLLGMLIYSALVTVVLAYAGWVEHLAGPVLWPAIALHAVLTILLALTFRKSRK